MQRERARDGTIRCVYNNLQNGVPFHYMLVIMLLLTYVLYSSVCCNNNIIEVPNMIRWLRVVFLLLLPQLLLFLIWSWVDNSPVLRPLLITFCFSIHPPLTSLYPFIHQSLSLLYGLDIINIIVAAVYSLLSFYTWLPGFCCFVLFSYMATFFLSAEYQKRKISLNLQRGV